MAELKGLFSKLYTDANDVFDLVSNITKTNENQEVLERVSQSLISVKDYVADYITDTFDTKSYTENMTIYNKFLICMKSIANILDEVSRKTEKLEDKNSNN